MFLLERQTESFRLGIIKLPVPLRMCNKNKEKPLIIFIWCLPRVSEDRALKLWITKTTVKVVRRETQRNENRYLQSFETGTRP